MKTQTTVLGRLFKKCMLDSWDFYTQRILGLLGSEKVTDYQDCSSDVKPLRFHTTQSFIDESSKFEEWIYLCLKVMLTEQELGLSLETFLKSLEIEVSNSNNHPMFHELLSTKSVNFLEFLFALLQQTVEKKIHFSVIIEAKTEKIEQDEYYGFVGDTRDRGNGIQIHMSDLDFIISKFEEKCQLLFSKEVNQESFSAVDNSESSRELDAEKFWSFEQATNIVEHIH